MGHRMPSERITHLAIDGDVMLNEVRLSASPSSMPYAGAPPPYAAAPPYPGTVPPYPGAPPPYGSAPMARSPYPMQAGSVPYGQGAYGSSYPQPVSLLELL